MGNRTVTPRERVMLALKGQCPGKIPFTVYENMLPRCTTERLLRNRGLCVVHRMQSYRRVYPDIKTQSHSYVDERGRGVTRTVYGTPYGEMSCLTEPAGFTSWKHEYAFKGKEDYKKLLSMIKNCTIVPCYDAVIKRMNLLGDDFVIRDQLMSEPLQEIISVYMGPETFCYEWMDNRDEVLKLYDALLSVSRKAFQAVAGGPLEFANLGGNVVPQMIGADTFRKYHIPVYNEAAELLHKAGKLVGSHFDADNAPIMEDIGHSMLDYIEAYDAGISPPLKEAREKWPNKVLWINWPSSWHLLSEAEVYDKTKELIQQAAPWNGFIIGITEDVPEDRWESNFRIIMDAIGDFGK